MAVLALAARLARGWQETTRLVQCRFSCTVGALPRTSGITVALLAIQRRGVRSADGGPVAGDAPA